MPKKAVTKVYQYHDFGEVLIPREAALLLKTSPPRIMEWLHTGKTPMGEITAGVHYFKTGYEFRIIKDRLCELFGILPKEIRDVKP